MDRPSAAHPIRTPLRAAAAVLSAGLVGALAMLSGLAGTPARAAVEAKASLADIEPSIAPSGLPVPRFLSIRRNEVRMRRGPSVNHAIEWVYRNAAGLPVVVVAESDLWRQVRDSEGVTGWIHASQLDGRRKAMVLGDVRTLYQEPARSSEVVARVSGGALGALEACAGDWCRLSFDGARGWLPRGQIWGALPDETVD